MPSAEQFGIWILVAIALVPAANVIVGWFRGAPKREVSFTANYASAEALGQVEGELHQRIDQVDTDVKALKDSIIKNGEDRRIRIEGKVEAARLEAWNGHQGLADRISAVAIQVGKVESHLAESTTTVNAQVILLSQKLDRFIERESDRHNHKPHTR